nr:4Fe-4S dicluster domain-containing protein [uncultured Desulfobacter sp.]
MANAFFIDVSRCTACRGCQVACKQWHDLPAIETKQRGTHQNPPDLNPFNYKVVRFREHLVDNQRKQVVWNFFPDQCRHCMDAPCKSIADAYVDGAVLQDDVTGMVIYTEKTQKLSEDEFDEMRDICPYDIPRRNPDTGAVVKCDSCYGRVSNGLLPMCVATCPTGTMNFGKREKMVALAHSRLVEVKKQFPKAQLVDEDSVNVIYLITDEPDFYADYVMAQANPSPSTLTRKEFFASIAKPLVNAGAKI